jgi:arylsulfatase A-like enzyme
MTLPPKFKYVFLLFIGVISYNILAQDSKKPNIIWIVCEDISPLIGVYGDPIVNTPNIDQLSSEGIRYTKVYTTAGVCAPSRSSIITGMNQISIGTQHMRTRGIDPKYFPKELPNYGAVLPENVKAFPEYLRLNGYYTTNNAKEDYQFDAPVTVWDESSPAASYRNRKKGQPFFSIFNIAITHESFLMRKPDSLTYDPNLMNVPMYYENTETSRTDHAILYTRIDQMDKNVGEIISQLKSDGVYDDSYVMFYSDHGGNLPWTKREILERGTHIPFVVKLPKGAQSGTYNKNLISSIDFAPTILSIAGIEPPTYLQGKAFLGEYKNPVKNKYVFAARDRMDELYDRVRSVYDGSFRYIYNFMLEQPKYQNIVYRQNIDTMKEILEMKEAGTITNPYLLDWFNSTKPVEELYYTAKDPDEVRNLANDPAYKAKLTQLKKVLFDWLKEVGDMSEISEKEMVLNHWWKGTGKPLQTAKPKIVKRKTGITLSCNTAGASIAYKIVDKNRRDSISRPMHTWDFAMYYAPDPTQEIKVEVPWHVYDGTPIQLEDGDEILVKAERIGFSPSEATFKK